MVHQIDSYRARWAARRAAPEGGRRPHRARRGVVVLFGVALSTACEALVCGAESPWLRCRQVGGVTAALTGSGGVALLLVRPQPVSLAGGSGGAPAPAAGSTRRRRRATSARRAERGQAAGTGAPGCAGSAQYWPP